MATSPAETAPVPRSSGFVPGPSASQVILAQAGSWDPGKSSLYLLLSGLDACGE